MFVAMIQTKRMKGLGDDPGWQLYGPFETKQEASAVFVKYCEPGRCLPGSIMEVHKPEEVAELTKK